MRALFVIILLAALVLPSGRAPASPPSDISAADVQWLRTQAAQGDVMAQRILGRLYANGDGVPKDYKKAAQWWEQAAAQGDSTAQHNLGLLYANGQGVPQNYTTARQWWEKAAAQGNARAQFNLGVLYHEGHGVPRDDVRAYMWLNLAAASTGPAQKSAANNRDVVERHMTPAQVAEAQRLTQQCQVQQFKGC